MLCVREWSLTHVASPCVQKDNGFLGNGNSIVDDIIDGGTRQRKSKHGKVSQALSYQGNNVLALLIIFRIAHGLVGRVELFNLLLDVGNLVKEVILLDLESNTPVECQS